MTFIGSYDALRNGFITGFDNNKTLETLVTNCSKTHIESLIFSADIDNAKLEVSEKELQNIARNMPM